MLESLVLIQGVESILPPIHPPPHPPTNRRRRRRRRLARGGQPTTTTIHPPTNQPTLGPAAGARAGLLVGLLVGGWLLLLLLVGLLSFFRMLVRGPALWWLWSPWHRPSRPYFLLHTLRSLLSKETVGTIPSCFIAKPSWGSPLPGRLRRRPNARRLHP